MRVLAEVLLAAARQGADAVDEARQRERVLAGVDGLDEPALVDLVALGAVLHLPGGGTSLRQGGQQEAEQQGDDGHHHQQLDEREALSLSHVEYLRWNRRSPIVFLRGGEPPDHWGRFAS